LMKERRKALVKAVERTAPASSSRSAQIENQDASPRNVAEVEMANEEDIVAVFQTSNKDSYRDEEFYMSHYHKDANTEKGYSLTDGASSFAEQARGLTFDLMGDVTVAERNRHKLTWDKKKKKFIKGDGSGADNVKLVRTENGTRLPASYRSGRFDEWKKKAKVTIPKVGEQEAARPPSMAGGRRWRHNKVSEAKPLDKLSKDYNRKLRQLKKKGGGTAGGEVEDSQVKDTGKSKSGGKRHGGKPLRRVKSEIKTVDQIHKTRRIVEKRRAKNARPSRKSKR